MATQERVEMRLTLDNAGEVYNYYSTGGWAFHEWRGEMNPDDYTYCMERYAPDQAARMIADGSITNNPVFNRDFSPMFDHDASLDDQWLAVAKYVPAVSSPVGGVAVMEHCITDNVNMNLDSSNGGVPRPNEWGRCSSHKYGTDWQHSDMKDMAYLYVYKLYEQLIQKGNLK